MGDVKVKELSERYGTFEEFRFTIYEKPIPHVEVSHGKVGVGTRFFICIPSEIFAKMIAGFVGYDKFTEAAKELLNPNPKRVPQEHE